MSSTPEPQVCHLANQQLNHNRAPSTFTKTCIRHMDFNENIFWKIILCGRGDGAVLDILLRDAGKDFDCKTTEGQRARRREHNG